MEHCIFCAIAGKEKEADIIYETDAMVVIRDIKPSAPVHLLVIPKRHIDSVNELGEGDGELAGGMILLAKKMAREQNISDGYQLRVNVGEKGGQIVPHLHLHLLGGWEENFKF